LKLNNKTASVVLSPCLNGQGDLAYLDINDMSDKTLEIFSLEKHTWLKSMEHMEQENDFLKNSISLILDSYSGNELVIWAEDYQHLILQREAAIGLLRDDIAKLEGLISNANKIFSSALYNIVYSDQKKIRQKLEYLENEFRFLKHSFFRDFEKISFIN
jgi:hypothetical protein